MDKVLLVRLIGLVEAPYAVSPFHYYSYSARDGRCPFYEASHGADVRLDKRLATSQKGDTGFTAIRLRSRSMSCVRHR